MTGPTLSGFTVPDSKPEWKIQEYGQTNRQIQQGTSFLGLHDSSVLLPRDRVSLSSASRLVRN